MTQAALAKDEVGAHDGVYKGAVAHAPGAIAGDANGAARFDGATSYVEVGDVLPFLGNAPFTVEAWTSLDADADAKNPTCIASKSFAQTGATGGVTEGYTFYLATGSHELTMARYRSSTDDAVRGPVVTTGVFTHVVATYDGATTALWLNGQPVASAPSTKVLVSHTKPLVLGAGRGGIFCFFKGALDEIAFYAAALPGDRIRAHYQAGIK